MHDSGTITCKNHPTAGAFDNTAPYDEPEIRYCPHCNSSYYAGDRYYACSSCRSSIYIDNLAKCSSCKNMLGGKRPIGNRSL
ncbi:MAG: hypothetical protein HFJ50_08860 [Clostridia bacterium]|nr:hypothetical protein [Clostridia bacterium]